MALARQGILDILIYLQEDRFTICFNKSLNDSSLGKFLKKNSRENAKNDTEKIRDIFKECMLNSIVTAFYCLSMMQNYLSSSSINK